VGLVGSEGIDASLSIPLMRRQICGPKYSCHHCSRTVVYVTFFPRKKVTKEVFPESNPATMDNSVQILHAISASYQKGISAEIANQMDLPTRTAIDSGGLRS